MKFKMFIVMALLCMVTTVPGFMQDTIDFKTEAEALKSLGLFSGTNNGFELDRAPSRVEAAAMLVKLLGAEDEAKAKHYKHPFTDVPTWATDFIGYLYENKLTTGIGNNQFGSSNPMSAKDFTVFVLKSLGYASDFAYADTMSFAVTKGLISSSEMSMLTSNNFKRDEMVLLSFNALKTKLKGEAFTLGDKFATSGEIDAQTAFKLGLTLRNEITVKGLKGGTASEIVLNNSITFGTLKLQEITKLFISPDITWQPKTYDVYQGALWINFGTTHWNNKDMYFEVIVYNKGVQVFKQEIINTNYGVNKYFIKPSFPKMIFDEIKIVGYPKEMRIISDALASKVQFVTMDDLSALEADIIKYKNVSVALYGNDGTISAAKIEEARRFALLQIEFLDNNKSIINYFSNPVANQDSQVSVVFNDELGSNVGNGTTPNSYVYTMPKPNQSVPVMYQLLNMDGTIGKVYIGVGK